MKPMLTLSIILAAVVLSAGLTAALCYAETKPALYALRVYACIIALLAGRVTLTLFWTLANDTHESALKRQQEERSK